MDIQKHSPALNQYLLRLADSSLTMGQRLAEWCGHGPYLEEDIALTNVSLDLIGHADIFYQMASDVSEDKATPDSLAFLRDAHQYRNPIITELPKGDFAYSTLKQYFIDVFNNHLYKSLKQSSYKPLALAAQKASMEVNYHLSRSEAWVQRLSLGTEVAHQKMQKALDELWFYTPELFEVNSSMEQLMDAQIIPDYKQLQINCTDQMVTFLKQQQLSLPESGWVATGGLEGEHSEHLGYLLAEMQFLPRAYPGCEW
ncbi:MAG: 1,2-phenylacetyl-CoA epoxidase subunit PaaC [Marinicella sp.]